ncbi:MAG: hypothetical protein MUP14_07750 [Dehalococcoidia bacterium]|nr:hypothetical protein [Dehalococcoidia bacterium]
MKSTSAGTDYLVPVLSECTAYTGGTTTALACITKYWYKTQATVGGDESWVAVTQVAGSTFTTAALQGMYYFEVVADQLSDGYTHILVTIPDSGGGGTQPIAVLYIPFGLKTQRIPSNMPNWLNPGAANV